MSFLAQATPWRLRHVWLAQCIALLVVLAVATLRPLITAQRLFWFWPLLQGGIALWLARRWRLPRGLQVLQLLFPLAFFWHLQHTCPLWIYPIALGAMALIFGGGLLSRVPLYHSNAHAWEQLSLLAEDAQKAQALSHFPLQVMDLGAGMGGPLSYLSLRHPHIQCYGVESSLLVWLMAWTRTLRAKNCHIRLGSLWKVNLEAFDVVFAFLSPVPMPTLWEKVQREMRPGTLFISHSFPVPKVSPACVIPLPGKRSGALYVYRIG